MNLCVHRILCLLVHPVFGNIEYLALDRTRGRVDRPTKCQIPLAQNRSHSGLSRQVEEFCNGIMKLYCQLLIEQFFTESNISPPGM